MNKCFLCGEVDELHLVRINGIQRECCDLCCHKAGLEKLEENDED